MLSVVKKKTRFERGMHWTLICWVGDPRICEQGAAFGQLEQPPNIMCQAHDAPFKINVWFSGSQSRKSGGITIGDCLSMVMNREAMRLILSF